MNVVYSFWLTEGSTCDIHGESAAIYYKSEVTFASRLSECDTLVGKKGKLKIG